MKYTFTPCYPFNVLLNTSSRCFSMSDHLENVYQGMIDISDPDKIIYSLDDILCRYNVYASSHKDLRPIDSGDVIIVGDQSYALNSRNHWAPVVLATTHWLTPKKAKALQLSLD